MLRVRVPPHRDRRRLRRRAARRTLLGTPSVAGAAGSPPPSPAARKASAQAHRITLITGDVITVKDAGDGKSTVTVDPVSPTSGVIHTQTVGKDLYVWPEVALPYLAANRLDRDLFNVTELIADGYDDAHSSVLPLIVEYKDAATAPQARAADVRGDPRTAAARASTGRRSTTASPPRAPSGSRSPPPR